MSPFTSRGAGLHGRRPAGYAVGAALLAGLVALAALLSPAIAQPARTLTMAVGDEPDRLFNPLTTSGHLAANFVFDPLVGLTDQMQPYPVLAAELPSADNGLLQLTGDGGDRRLIVTMPLRPDVTWSDGQPFTADDVVYTWQLMMNPQSGFDTTVTERIKSVDKADDLTVRFTYLSANEARALDPERYRNLGNNPVYEPTYQFGLYDAPAIYPRHKLRELIGDDPRHNPEVANLERSDFARRPVGTGPYVLSAWEPGYALTFTSRGVALPQRQAQPALSTVIMRVMPDKNESITALGGGQIQVIAQDTLDAADAPVLDSLPGVQARYTPGNAWEHLTFNLDQAVLGESAVRQAMAHAINRGALNDTILFGKGEVPRSQVPSWSWAFEPNAPSPEFNPALAEQLLERAGWVRGPDGIRAKAGKRLSFRYWSTPAAFRPGLMAMVKDQLAQVGIEVSVDVFPSSTFFDPAPNAPQNLGSRQFDMVQFAWVSTYDPGLDAMYSMHSNNVPSRANAFRGGNYGNYKNSRSDELLSQAQNSIDPVFRRNALAEAQMIWQSDLPVLPLLVRPITTATSPRLVNFKPTPAARGETWNVEAWDITPAP